MSDNITIQALGKVKSVLEKLCEENKEYDFGIAVDIDEDGDCYFYIHSVNGCEVETVRVFVEFDTPFEDYCRDVEGLMLDAIFYYEN